METKTILTLKANDEKGNTFNVKLFTEKHGFLDIYAQLDYKIAEELYGDKVFTKSINDALKRDGYLGEDFHMSYTESNLITFNGELNQENLINYLIPKGFLDSAKLNQELWDSIELDYQEFQKHTTNFKELMFEYVIGSRNYDEKAQLLFSSKKSLRGFLDNEKHCLDDSLFESLERSYKYLSNLDLSEAQKEKIKKFECPENLTWTLKKIVSWLKN